MEKGKGSSLRNTFIYSVLIIVALIGALILWKYPGKTPSLGVVNMRLLIAQRAENLAKAVPVGTQVRARQIQDLTDHLREELQIFAQDNGVVILDKRTVAGGELPDYTEVVLSDFKKDESL